MSRIVFVSPSMNFVQSMGVYAPLMEAAPPIGITRLAAICEGLGMTCEVVDAYSERLSVEETLRRVDGASPDIIAVSCLTPSAKFVEDVLSGVRERRPGARVVMGNTHASLFAHEFLNKGLADVVVHGEGEHTLRDLASAWENGGTVDENIRGITFLRDGNVIKTPDREPIRDLDSLPVPSWRLTPYHLYGLLPFVTMAKPAFTVEGSRGCPYRCHFCSLSENGKIYRRFSAGRIVDEFEILIEEYGAKQIAFADAIFPIDDSQGIEFCESLMKRIPEKKRVVWASETRTDALTDALLIAMKKAGCGRILMGMESGSDETLKSAQKNLSSEKNRAAVEACRRAGIQSCGFFILGLPGESKENAEKTIGFACELPLDVAKFNIAIPYPGSRFYEELESSGALRHKRWEDYTCYATDPDQLPWINPAWLGADLIAFQYAALRRFYLRPRMIFRHIFIIRSVKLRYLLIGGWILFSSLFKNRRRR